MVAEANKSRAAPIYAAASFRSREAVGALVALTRKALIEEFGRELAPLGLNAAQALVIARAWRSPRAARRRAPRSPRCRSTC